MVRVAVIGPNSPPSLRGGIATAQFSTYQVLSTSAQTAYFTYDDDIGGTARGGIHRTSVPVAWAAAVDYAVLPFKLLCAGIEGARYAYHLHGILRAAVGSRRMAREMARFRPDVMIIPDHNLPILFVPRRLKRTCTVIYGVHHVPLRFARLGRVVPRHSRLDATIATLLERSQLRYVNRLTGPSRYILDEFSRNHRHAIEQCVVPNPVAQFQYGRRRTGGCGCLRLLVPSAASYLKGRRYFDDFLRLLGRSIDKRWEIHVNGTMDERWRARVSRLAVELNLPLHLHGHLSPVLNRDLVARVDCVVSLAVSESFGMAVVEALAVGTPVIGFRQGAYGEIVREGEGGYLVDEGDVGAVVRVLRRLGDKDRRAGEVHTGLGAERYSPAAVLRVYSALLRPFGYQLLAPSP